jgi:hypothetical protein
VEEPTYFCSLTPRAILDDQVEIAVAPDDPGKDLAADRLGLALTGGS